MHARLNLGQQSTRNGKGKPHEGWFVPRTGPVRPHQGCGGSLGAPSSRGMGKIWRGSGEDLGHTVGEKGLRSWVAVGCPKGCRGRSKATCGCLKGSDRGGTELFSASAGGMAGENSHKGGLGGSGWALFTRKGVQPHLPARSLTTAL